MSLPLNLLHSPDLVSMHYKVAELMSRVEARACPIILVSCQYDDGMIRERKRKRIDIGTVQGKPDHDCTVALQELNDIANWSSRELPGPSYPCCHLFDLSACRGKVADWVFRNAVS